MRLLIIVGWGSLSVCPQASGARLHPVSQPPLFSTCTHFLCSVPWNLTPHFSPLPKAVHTYSAPPHLPLFLRHSSSLANAQLTSVEPLA